MVKPYKKIQKNRGMTYVELIVVMSIFAVMTSITLFNYREFEGKVEIKNLSNEIAIQIVEAQKSAINGKLPPYGGQIANWKPSYGIHFNRTSDPKSFVYFADLDQSKVYTPGTLTCVPGSTFECVNKITITKGNFISNMSVYLQADPTTPIAYDTLYLTFTRPNSGLSVAGTGAVLAGVSFVQITVSSPSGITARVKVYASGRVQIN